MYLPCGQVQELLLVWKKDPSKHLSQEKASLQLWQYHGHWIGGVTCLMQIPSVLRANESAQTEQKPVEEHLEQLTAQSLHS